MKKLLKRILKLFFLSLGGILLAGLLFLLAATIFTFIPVNDDFSPPEDGVEIFVISNGLHVDLCVPVETKEIDWREFVPTEPFARRNWSYIAFGYGDRGFYLNTPTWADLSLLTASNALFLPSEPVMHVTYHPGKPKTGDYVRSVKISQEQYQTVIAHIKSGFHLTGENQISLIEGYGYSGWQDNFYQATGAYHLFNTCNMWANDGLKKGGVKTASWAPFDKCILYHFEP